MTNSKTDLDETRIPVLIGGGQLTDKRDPEDAATPIELMVEAAQKAAADAGPGDKLLQAIDTLVAVGLAVDDPVSDSGAAGMFRNVPLSVSNRLGIDPARRWYTVTGGNTPQLLVNKFAERIAQGECSAVLLTGAEALHTMIGRFKRGLPMDAWQEDPGGEPEMLGVSRPPATPHERAYGIQEPATVYPLFENALRGKYGLTLAQHQEKLGELFHGFNRVAAENPLSWFPTPRSAEEIATVSAENRYVGFPYTKYLNSVIQVNQGAAVIMTSRARARELGVAEDRLVYLHGCGDANDIWNISERADFSSSPAIRTIGSKALAMAGKTIADMDYFDLYSCFPSAVQIACDELGIAYDDPRGLTVTGGLPYFGGAGNDYVMHSIATMMDKLRARPGSYGLLNSNGWYVTKHAIGIYSTAPITEPWQREDPQDYQEAILDQAQPGFTETPEGPATIETYTVLHGRKGVERALVIGRLEDGTRFIADTPDDANTLQAMMDQDVLGLAGQVSSESGRNRFVPDFR
ncbi:MAG: acetyl-CoA acetyltransferase [Halieaceae bacterium]